MSGCCLGTSAHHQQGWVHPCCDLSCPQAPAVRSQEGSAKDPGTKVLKRNALTWRKCRGLKEQRSNWGKVVVTCSLLFHIQDGSVFFTGMTPGFTDFCEWFGKTPGTEWVKYEACSREASMGSSMALGHISVSHLIKATTCFSSGRGERDASGNLKEEENTVITAVLMQKSPFTSINPPGLRGWLS